MEPFIAQIIMFGGNFAPRGWALCDGQLLPISSNSALFSILGTTYGGDGRTTFGLPDLRGRVAMHQGSGPGLTTRRLGEDGGLEANTLNTNHLPAHDHTFAQPASTEDGNQSDPENNYPAVHAGGFFTSTDADLGAGTTGSAGGGQAVNNMPPFQAVNFIIALVGTFPSRN